MSKKMPMMGFWDLWEGAEVLEKLANSLYPRDMHTQKQTTERERILAFWKAHGLDATKDAFGVSRPTLYRWQANPVPASRAHTHGYPKRKIPPLLAAEIVRIRTLHPGLGKEKLTPLLKVFCTSHALPAPSEPTVGRMLQQLKAEGVLKAPVSLRLDVKSGKLVERKPREKVKKLRRSGYLPEQPGDLLQVDGVLKINYGSRRYVFTAVDLVTRITWSKAYSSASSRHGKDFLNSILETAPFTVAHIQTDNGSEFLKEFHQAAVEAELVHFFNYVKQPKYQGWIERFNRTIQEEFIDWNLDSLAFDLEIFNQKLTHWTLWYNTERIHRGLNQKTAQGVQKFTPLQYLNSIVVSQRG